MAEFFLGRQQKLMKLNLIKISQLIIMVLTISTLLGCYNKEEFKQRIKDGWDEVLDRLH
ncbi:hypothetical protein H3S75_13460 [Gilliamella sp. B14384G15]|uniref:hypothetical protein n=1 Tax=unclassified Gilliamella TaxID=2685620 RepID=UPI0018DD1513|nr:MULTISPECIES: hypothetical protein [unclassified Gilliamella]MBI0032241.1 hypothetical protein [Gilliamella sp. B14384G15]MBI0059351.1 hypothetical protein [Gilliamella sp. B14384G12]